MAFPGAKTWIWLDAKAEEGGLIKSKFLADPYAGLT
jgi:hypothetical protein